MGRAFEYRKAAKLKRWGHMAKTFTRLGKQIAIAVKAGGPEPETTRHCVRLSLLVSVKTCRRIILNVLSRMRSVRTRATIRV